MNSYALYKKAESLVRQRETRDALQIAKEIGIQVRYKNAFTDLLGMYTCRWNHRIIILNANMGRNLTAKRRRA